MVTTTPDEIYLDLKQAAERLFGLRFFNPVPLTLGLLNLKWRVETENGLFVLKQFSQERYARYDIRKVAIEQQQALREQVRQYEHGTVCPRVLTHDGEAIHSTPNGERFIVMEYVSGDNLRPGTLNEEQMYNLGRATGHMHNICNDGTYGKALSTKFVPPSIPQRLDRWKKLYVVTKGNDRVLDLIERQIRATEQFTLDSISLCESGFAHRDLWVDNILFIGNQLSAILDFDRFGFDYPELDVARAIMSGVLNGNRFNLEAATAFLEGYRSKRVLKKGTLVQSLHLLWYLESVWWVGPQIHWNRYQEVQFANEMSWLAENLTNLASLFGGV